MTLSPSRKPGVSFLWNVLKILLALGLVFYAFSRAEPGAVRATLKSTSVFWLIIAGTLYFLLTVLKALQYHVLMPGRLGYPQILNVIIWQNAVSNFLLAGAGIAAYITMTRVEHDVKMRQSVTIFALTKIGDLIAIWVALLLASVFVWSEIGILRTPLVILLTGIGAAILFFCLTILFRQRFVFLLDGVLKRLNISRFKFIESGMSYLQTLAEMDQNKVLSIFRLLLLYSFLYLAVTIAATYTNFLVFHLRLDPVALIFVTLMIQLVSYFPISVFGGLGITETSSLYFWSFFGVSQDILAPALIGIRIVFYLFNLIPLIYLPVYSALLKPHEQN